MAVVPQLVRYRFKGFRVCLYHTFRLSEGVDQEGSEAVDIQKHSFNLAPNAAAHHIKARSQLEQGMPV